MDLVVIVSWIVQKAFGKYLLLCRVNLCWHLLPGEALGNISGVHLGTKMHPQCFRL